ncbi:MAG: four-carbon acid sugar kinase family protein [Planctomycetota bacterium]|nr:MAG: four-carbon acid sugar kinase family protein [Planctomycetota bacterium]
MKIGCIADDFTGATDIASGLVRGGLRVVQMFGTQGRLADEGSVDAVVIALKTRSAGKEEAVRQSLAALKVLLGGGAQRILFKYCSTFDSTPEGNIGPVADALVEHLQCRSTIHCPAFPGYLRTQYMGHLFVGRELLSESGMRHHPLTPMTDANLVRFLQLQTPARVGLIDYPVVASGPEAVRGALASLESDGIRHILVDVLDETHLATIATAVADRPLVAGGSAIGAALVPVWRSTGLLAAETFPPPRPQLDGATVALAGSCSAATCRQVATFAQTHPCLHIDLLGVTDTAEIVQEAVQWADLHRDEVPLIATTVPPERLREIQAALGQHAAAELAEHLLAEIAAALLDRGFRQFIVAGGETSGAVASRLGISSIRIGPEICTGVPWTASVGAPSVALALKSGNFGSDTFFEDAWRRLQQC